LSKTLKDGAYVAIGLGVLGFQRAQVHRVELTRQLEGWFEHLGEWPTAWSSQVETYALTARERGEATRSELAQLARALDELVQPVLRQLDEQVDRLEQYLPHPARGIVQSVRAAASDPQQRLRNAVGLD
jgi:hypothetical protein